MLWDDILSCNDQQIQVVWQCRGKAWTVLEAKLQLRQRQVQFTRNIAYSWVIWWSNSDASTSPPPLNSANASQALADPLRHCQQNIFLSTSWKIVTTSHLNDIHTTISQSVIIHSHGTTRCPCLSPWCAHVRTLFGLESHDQKSSIAYTETEGISKEGTARTGGTTSYKNKVKEWKGNGRRPEAYFISREECRNSCWRCSQTFQNPRQSER